MAVQPLLPGQVELEVIGLAVVVVVAVEQALVGPGEPGEPGEPGGGEEEA